jgi:hypothetical protein
VLTLDGQTYRTHGEFGRGAVATSVLFPGVSVSVDAVFAAGEGAAGLVSQQRPEPPAIP